MKFVLGMILLIAGCSDSDGAAYTLVFHEDSAEFYPGPGCPGMYCTAWQPSDRTMTGTLSISDTQAVLHADGTTWIGYWAAPDARIRPNTMVALKRPMACGDIDLTFTSPESGTFRQGHDCHGRESVGKMQVR